MSNKISSYFAVRSLCTLALKFHTPKVERMRCVSVVKLELCKMSILCYIEVMSKVAVLRLLEENGVTPYLAIQGNKQALGNTVGTALDAFREQFGDNANTIIIQNLRADVFFLEQDQRRLAELMQQWHVAQEHGKALPDSEQNELQMLIEKELEAAKLRAAELAQSLE
jgi:hypothetical protein